MERNTAALDKLKSERSLVIIKPDGVVRHLVGEILGRFERKGLKIVAMKMVHATKAQVAEHYEVTEEWIQDTGQRTYDSYVSRGLTPPAEPRELALEVNRKLMKYLGAGPSIVMVLEGAHVVEVVRKMRGATSPLNADVGTVGFDFSVESYQTGDAGGWAIRNILHGSDSVQSAEREIKIWFDPSEIIDYKTAIEDHLYTDAWHMEARD